jgi:hypothetical protein
MGFCDFRAFNQALLARQAWRLLSNPVSFCARVLKAKYYTNSQLQDTVFTGNASSTWQAIQYGHELLKKGLVWAIGNGRLVRVWRDPWIPRPDSYRPVSLQGDCHIRRVSDMLDVHGAWDMDLLQRHFIQVDI